MSDFDATWLDLREPADSAARASVLERLLTTALPAREPLRIVDLAAGTGSNLRHLAPRLGGAQAWRLVDANAALLDAVPNRLRAHGWDVDGDGRLAHGRGVRVHLAAETRDLAPRDLAHGAVPADADLVTASALLDLVSRDWLDRLAAACADQGAAVLLAVSVDGTLAWEPAAELDGEVRALVERHQRTDKGFGPALGPDAPQAAVAAFERHGYGVETAASPWRLGPGDAQLQQHLHAGWAAAASEIAPEREAAIHDWLAHRMDLLAAGVGTVTVGHQDVLALPGG